MLFNQEPFTDDGDLPSNYNNDISRETIDPGGDQIEAILTYENSRLNDKKNIIDPLYNTKQRQDAQLRSTTLRKNAFTYICLVSFGVMGIVMSLFIIKNNFPVPEWIMNGLLMIAISGGIIYILMLYADILKRDAADFEKVDFGLLVNVDKGKDPNPTKGVILNVSVTVDCSGNKCCPNGSFFWGNVCNKTAEPFTTGILSNPSSFLSFSPNPSFTPV